ncbi:protein of unknown function DUF2303 [Vibrio phage 1.151.O._10N.222.46.B1]|nr:protein of unknown function DUF2303 [Vibrio phage 1.151.O._10N.222.46.B1]
MQNEKAIQEIIKLNNTDKVIEHLKGAATKSNLIVIPDNFVLKNLEGYMTNRDQYRASMSTQNIAEFVRYNKAYGVKDQSQCFVDAEDMEATSVFDLGTTENPLHCKHNASLKLKSTAAYNELLRFNGRKVNQRDAAEWVEDYEEFITAFDEDNEEITISNVSAALRSLTVRKEQSRTNNADNFQENQSKYESVAIQTKDGLKMPATIKFICVPFNGLDARSFELRHSQIDSGEKPVLVFRIKRLEVHQEHMADEFKEKLDKQLADAKAEVETYVGSLSV